MTLDDEKRKKKKVFLTKNWRELFFFEWFVIFFYANQFINNL